MPEPAFALLVFASVAVVSAAVAWPRRGLWARIVRRLRLTDKVCIEDTLKHLHACNRRGVQCTLQSLAGQLGVPTARASQLLQTVTERGLAKEGVHGPVLTGIGREWAVRLVRTHRLWESYLAEHTGVAPEEWHDEAERVEHELDQRETDSLAAKLGHPRWDPHGDPIPTSQGELPAAQTLSLLDATLETELCVTHLEDEPPATYAELLEIGIGLGKLLTITARNGASVAVELDGRRVELAATAARNVGVRPVAAPATGSAARAEAPTRRRAPAASTTLAAIAPGESATVISISPACAGPQRRRLLDLGVVPGAEIRSELRAGGGDPVGYRICGALIALRREQARFVSVTPVPVTPVSVTPVSIPSPDDRMAARMAGPPSPAVRGHHPPADCEHHHPPARARDS